MCVRCSLAECMCHRVDMRAPGSHLATFRPISSPRLMTERGPGSSLILSTSGCSTESVATNNPIYQRLLTNCKHPTLLPLLLHIIVSCLVVKQQKAKQFLFPYLIFWVCFLSCCGSSQKMLYVTVALYLTRTRNIIQNVKTSKNT